MTPPPLSSCIRQHPDECELNAYFWKQQDFFVNTEELVALLLQIRRSLRTG